MSASRKHTGNTVYVNNAVFNSFTVIQRWDRWAFVWEEWKWRHWQHWQQTSGITHQKTVSSFTLKTLQTYSKNLFKYLTENWFQQYWAIGKAISLRLYNKYIMSVKDLAVLVVFEQQQKFLLVLMQLKYVVYYWLLHSKICCCLVVQKYTHLRSQSTWFYP